MATVHVEMPYHLRTLAQVTGPVDVEVAGAVTVASILDALEAGYPVLRGTMRDHVTRERRAFVRFFACGVDWSLEPTDTVLPEDVARGKQPFLVVGAIAGGRT